MAKYTEQKTGIECSCLRCSKNYRVYPFLIKKGYGKFCSRHCRSKYRSKLPESGEQIKAWSIKGQEATRGANHPSWKGGISSSNEKLRRSNKFKDWRTAVFSRDMYLCQDCGETSKDLHPHHLKHFSVNPKLRFDIKNGITLCGRCHRERHKDDARIWGSWAKRKSNITTNAGHFEYGG